MKKIFIFSCFSFLLLSSNILSAQNIIILKNKIPYPDMNLNPAMEIFQAKIIEGNIYTIEYLLTNSGPFYDFYYSKYDLSGNLIKRKLFPVPIQPAERLNGELHLIYRSIKMFVSSDNNIVCYIPFSKSYEFQSLYKFNLNLDSIQLITERIPGYNNYFTGIKGEYANDRSFLQLPDKQFLLFSADSVNTPRDSFRYQFRKLDEHLNVLWKTTITDKTDSFDLMANPYIRNSSCISVLDDRFVFSRMHVNKSFWDITNTSCYQSMYISELNYQGQTMRNDSFLVSDQFCHYGSQSFNILRSSQTENGYRMLLEFNLMNITHTITYDTITRKMKILPAVNKVVYIASSETELTKGYIQKDNSNPPLFYHYNADYSNAVLNQQTAKPIPDSFYLYYPNRFQKVVYYQTTWVDENPDTSYLLLGRITLQDSGTYLMIIPLANSFGYYNGKVYKDNNSNCQLDALTDKPYKNRTVEVTKTSVPFTYKYYSTTHDDGKFEVFTDTGQYSAKVFPPSNLWQVCPSAQTFTINSNTDTVTQNFYLKRTILCPQLEVSISSNRLRPCSPSTYIVHYCNHGTAAANPTSVKVDFDSALSVTGASVPYTISGNSYTFQLGNIGEDSCGQFSINTTLSCSAILGATYCATAHIYPDSLCSPASANWNRAIVEVKGQCLGDSVSFIIRNYGTGNMDAPKSYILFEDDIAHDAPVNFQLNSGQQIQIKRPANGTTQRLIAEQVDNFPYPSHPTAVVEGCGGLNPGFVNQFPNDDAADFIATSCMQSVSSFDPNDKTAVPEGINTEHLIPVNTDVEYKIRFQNTGTDTAFDVYILDTLSPKLDPATLQMGAASHSYTYEIFGEGQAVLKVVFPNINLVDSFHNEALSHGFFTYRIAQDTANILGDQIYNQADIYFDYNKPVITNKTLNTVGKDFLKADVVTEIKNVKYNVRDVKIFPNPFRDKTQIVVESDQLKNAILWLMTPEGKVIKYIPSTGNTFNVYREDLSSGMYIFRIIQDKEIITSGKIMVQ